MVCPFCLHKKNDVYNSRSTTSGTVWRRRRCLNCGQAFTTKESFDPSNTWKVKSTKATTPYSRAKLVISLLRACDHRINKDQATWYIFEAVEQRLLPIAAKNKLIITNKDIAATAMAILKKFDRTAYVKYMSYHQPAMDATALRRQLRRD